MSDVIALLEKMGALGVLSASDRSAAIRQAALDPEIASALLSGNSAQLNALLGARSTMVCGLFPAKDNETPADGDDPDEDVPVDDPKPDGLRRAA